MKDKIKYIIPLISMTVVSGYLFYIFVNTPNFITKIIMLPFLICGIASVLKIFFLLIDKPQFSNLCNKVYGISFFTYVFGFLGYWCYLNILAGSYIALVFAIPFLIIAIKMMMKTLFKGKIDMPENKAVKKLNIINPITISSLLIGGALICGIVMLFFGIKGTYDLNKKIQGYQEVTGYFTDYDIYSSDEDGTTYKLIYSYNVDGKQYTVFTDYGTNVIPKDNSTKTIKYNPNNPEEAIVTGTNASMGLIFIGFMFVIIPTIMILIFISKNGCFDKLNIDLIGAIIGLTFAGLGFGILYMLTGTFSILEMFRTYSLVYLIPDLIIILFIVVGIYLLISSLFFRRKTERI